MSVARTRVSCRASLPFPVVRTDVSTAPRQSAPTRIIPILLRALRLARKVDSPPHARLATPSDDAAEGHEREAEAVDCEVHEPVSPRDGVGVFREGVGAAADPFPRQLGALE